MIISQGNRPNLIAQWTEMEIFDNANDLQHQRVVRIDRLSYCRDRISKIETLQCLFIQDNVFLLHALFRRIEISASKENHVEIRYVIIIHNKITHYECLILKFCLIVTRTIIPCAKTV